MKLAAAQADLDFPVRGALRNEFFLKPLPDQIGPLQRVPPPRGISRRVQY